MIKGLLGGRQTTPLSMRSYQRSQFVLSLALSVEWPRGVVRRGIYTRTWSDRTCRPVLTTVSHNTLPRLIDTALTLKIFNDKISPTG